MESKELEFARKESEGSRRNPTEWLGRYIYTDIHEIFFFKFPIVFHEWLSRLATKQTNFQGEEPREWTPQSIKQLEEVRNHVLRVVYIWIDSIL